MRKPWGSGQIALLARLDTIKAELRQGHPLTVIYERHQAALGVGYRAFCKLVRQYAEDAKFAPQRPRARRTP